MPPHTTPCLRCMMLLCVYRMLLTIKYFGKRYPRLKWLRPLGPISACIVAIIAVVAGNLQNKGIKIVGHIPAGMATWAGFEAACLLMHHNCLLNETRRCMYSSPAQADL